MNRRIWKYQITDGICTLSMPIGAEVLCVQLQFDIPQIWALVYPNAPKEDRSFTAFATGDVVGTLSIVDYIGTFQRYEGNRIYHVFEVKG